MLTEGSDVFLQLSRHADERVLHVGRVTEANGTVFTAGFEEDELELEPGREILIYYNLNREFVKQEACIKTLLDCESDESESTRVLVGIEKTGEPLVAESRQCYRVSTVMEQLTVAFGGKDDCPLADVSHTGFGVISSEEYQLNEMVAATLKFEDLQNTGRVRIQSKRELRDGRFRYGVHCVDKDFETTIQQISMAVQRDQLRRLAGN